jgi:mannose-6-phosphate isomerase-like protein (cupin superfamily)
MKTIRSLDRPFVPASHENPLSPGVWKRVLLQKAELQPGTVQMVNWAKLPAGKTFAPHYHEDMQEIFVMIQGATEITVGAETAVLRRGDAIVIDPLEVHQMWNRGPEDAEYLALGISAGRGGRTVVVGEG